MKKKPLRWASLIFTIALLATITGCGQKTTPDVQGDAEKTSTDKQIILNFWDMTWGDAGYVKAATDICAKYTEKNPNVKVVYQSTPWAGRYEAFSTAIASGTPPDVSTGGGYQQHQFAELGEILPLDSIIDEWKKEGKLDDFPKGLVDYFKYDGKQVGIPFNIDLRGVWYRKDLFEKANIPMPKTWADLTNAAKTLTTKDHFGIVFPSSDSLANSVVINFFLNNGGGVFDANGKPNWTDKKNLETLDFIRTFKENGSTPEGITSYTEAEALKVFLQGKSAIYFGSMNVTDKAKEQGEDFLSKVALMPVLESPSGTKGTLVNLNALMAYKQTKHPEESKAFLKWWSENNQELWTVGKCSPFPARQTFFDMKYFQNERLRKSAIDELVPYMMPGVTHAKSANSAVAIIDGEKWWKDVLQEVMIGKKDNASILKEYNDKALTLKK